MIFRRRTTRIELERTTLKVELAPAAVFCARCGAAVAPPGAPPQDQAQLNSPLNQESSK